MRDSWKKSTTSCKLSCWTSNSSPPSSFNLFFHLILNNARLFYSSQTLMTLMFMLVIVQKLLQSLNMTRAREMKWDESKNKRMSSHSCLLLTILAKKKKHHSFIWAQVKGREKNRYIHTLNPSSVHGKLSITEREKGLWKSSSINCHRFGSET